MSTLQLSSEAEFKECCHAFMRRVDAEGGVITLACYTFEDLLESLHIDRQHTAEREVRYLDALKVYVAEHFDIDSLAITMSPEGVFREVNYYPEEVYGGHFNREAVTELMFFHFSKFILESEIVNFGLAFYPIDTNSFDELWDFSTQMAIRSIGSSDPIELYSPEKYKNEIRNAELRSVTRKLVGESLFDIHYQPQVKLQGPFSLIGCEALLRPRICGSDGRPFNAFETILQVEKSGWLTGILGLKIIERVCQDIQTWKEQGLSLVPVSVNISVRQLFISNFLESVDKVLKKYKVDKSEICFELTETADSGDNQYFDENIQGLYDNYNLYLDDYGTGHASSGHYMKHSFHGVKIDRSFVMNIDDASALSKKKLSIVSGLIASPVNYGQKVVVEGIETRGELECFMKLYPEGIGQGWLWSPAVAPNEFAEFLKLGCVPVK